MSVSVLPVRALSPVAEALLEAFYGSSSGNGIGLPLPDQTLRDLADRLGEPGQPTFLLWYSAKSKRATLFGVSRTDEGLEELRQVLRVYVGETYADDVSARAVSERDTDLSRAIRAYTEGRVLRVECDPRGTLNALALWLKHEQVRPKRERPDERATALLLRDLDTALLTRDARDAENVLRALGEGRRLDALNLHYLRVRVWAAFGHWQRLLDWEHLPTVLASARPAAVTDALLDAVGHATLSDLLSRHDLEGVLGAVREAVRPQFGGLLGRPAAHRSALGWAVEAFAAVDAVLESAESPCAEREDVTDARIDAARRVLDVADAAGAHAAWWLAPLRSRLPEAAPSKGDLHQRATDHFMGGDYAASLDIARGLPPGVSRTRLLLRLASELESADVDALAWNAFEQDPPASGGDPLVRLANDVLDRLTRRASSDPSLPRSWADWWTWVVADPGPSVSEAIGLLQANERWPVGHDEVPHLVRTLQETAFAKVHAEGTPYLIADLERTDALDDRARQALACALQDALLYSKIAGDTVVRLWVDRLPDALGGTITAAEYDDRLGGLMDLIDLHGGLPPLDRLIDAAGLLAASACPNPELRLRVLQKVVALTQQFHAQCRSSDRRLLADVAALIGRPEIAAALHAPPDDAAGEENDAAAWARLEGCRVGVYTLTPGAARLFQGLLEAKVPRVQVECSSALVATESLRALARGADVFLMVTGSATHSATACIESERGTRTLLRPAGKGASSLWRALSEYVDSP